MLKNREILADGIAGNHLTFTVADTKHIDLRKTMVMLIMMMMLMMLITSLTILLLLCIPKNLPYLFNVQAKY